MQQERALVRRFGVLTALGFMPLGLLVPTYVLLLTARGFGPTAIGALIAATAVVTLVLELPTGGLADVIGRRVVLIASSLVMAVGFVLFGLGSARWAIVVGLVLYASGRALSSGPLTSWFVDEVHAAVAPDRHDDVITRGLAQSSTATGIAVAAGSISGGWLASLGVHLGLDAKGDALVIGLSVPALLAAALFVVHAGLLLVLMAEEPRPRTSVRELVASVPGTVKEGVLLVVHRPVLRWFSVRWTVVPVGFLAFELISPVRLGELLDKPAQAAGVFGVVAAVAYLGQSLSALAAPRLVAGVGRLRASALLTVLAGVAFALAGHGG
ncbi:MAG: MFS transporter, partial [Ilumatobacter sp.]|nr:MFS transporter [Ilumatobacter sp.]MCB0985303.1 MFS transporter [Ilumatobacter sp.]